MTVQPGVLAVGATEHCYLEFDGTGEDLRAAVAPLVALPTTAGVNVVVGFRPSSYWGEPIATDWTDDLVGPDGFTMPATPHDAWVWISGGDRSAVFDAAREVISTLAPVARLATEIAGWVYQHDRDLTGFVDGTENPHAAQAPAVAATAEGTSVVLYQLWTHDAAAWDAQPDDVQERAMGRTKPDSVELDPLPENSHVARTVIEVDGEELDIFRRNVAYGGASDHGTVFVGFSHDQWRMAEMLRRMAGVGDGIRCALTHYLTPTSGAYYVVPSVEALLPFVPDEED